VRVPGRRRPRREQVGRDVRRRLVPRGQGVGLEGPGLRALRPGHVPHERDGLRQPDAALRGLRRLLVAVGARRGGLRALPGLRHALPAEPGLHPRHRGDVRRPNGFRERRPRLLRVAGDVAGRVRLLQGRVRRGRGRRVPPARGAPGERLARRGRDRRARGGDGRLRHLERLAERRRRAHVLRVPGARHVPGPLRPAAARAPLRDGGLPRRRPSDARGFVEAHRLPRVRGLWRRLRVGLRVRAGPGEPGPPLPAHRDGRDERRGPRRAVPRVRRRGDLRLPARPDPGHGRLLLLHQLPERPVLRAGHLPHAREVPRDHLERPRRLAAGPGAELPLRRARGDAVRRRRRAAALRLRHVGLPGAARAPVRPRAGHGRLLRRHGARAHGVARAPRHAAREARRADGRGGFAARDREEHVRQARRPRAAHELPEPLRGGLRGAHVRGLRGRRGLPRPRPDAPLRLAEARVYRRRRRVHPARRRRHPRGRLLRALQAHPAEHAEQRAVPGALGPALRGPAARVRVVERRRAREAVLARGVPPAAARVGARGHAPRLHPDAVRPHSGHRPRAPPPPPVRGAPRAHAHRDGRRHHRRRRGLRRVRRRPEPGPGRAQAGAGRGPRRVLARVFVADGLHRAPERAPDRGDGAARALPVESGGRVPRRVRRRAGKESEIPNFKGSSLGRFSLVSADFWTSDHLSERSRSVDAERARAEDSR